MAATSSLSALSRTPTPFSRYQTADEGTEGASNPAEDVTDISSPGDADAGAGADDDFGLRAPYHDAQGLPRELKNRVQIHLEEQTCKPPLAAALGSSLLPSHGLFEEKK